MSNFSTIEQEEVKSVSPLGRGRFSFAKIGIVTSIFLVVLLSVNTLFLVAPTNFPTGKTVVIEEGTSVREIAKTFSNRSIIKSPLLFEILIRSTAADDQVIAGEYFFDRRLALYEVIKRVTGGDYGMDPIKVTIPEGATVEEIGQILARHFSDISAERFADLATNLEGYLFPDTYYWLPIVREDQVIKEMS